MSLTVSGNFVAVRVAALFLLLLILSCVTEIQSGETKLYGPSIPEDTDWTSLWGLSFGEWKWEQYCSSGSYVIGMRLKIEGKQKIEDDTALNGIEFYCAKPWRTQLNSIRSGESEWGKWRSGIFCPAFQFAVGFELKLDKTSPGIKDNAGAVNLALYCSRDYGKKHRFGTGMYKKWREVKRLEGQGVPEGEDWGEWTGVKLCDQDAALCSLQTFVQEPQGGGVGRFDDSGLVTLAARCCTLEN